MSKKNGKKQFLHMDLDKITTFAVVVISLAALFVAWDQARIMRKQNEAEVWPLVKVQMSFDRSDDNHVRLTLVNSGIGPALIENWQMRVEGKTIHDSNGIMTDLFPASLPRPKTYDISDIPGQVIPAGGERVVLDARWPYSETNNKGFAELERMVRNPTDPKADLAVCYCSVFETCWVERASWDTARPAKVKSCKGTNWLKVKNP